MAHLVDTMAYHGRTPWHGLGQKIDANEDIDEWRIAAGLDWHIQKRPVFYAIKNGNGKCEPQVVKARFAHVRSDTQACLGIASNRFQLVQPEEIVEFYRDLLDNTDFRMETLGSLNGGAKLWALARYNDAINISGTDRVLPYLLLATANDGSMSTIGDFTSTRVVCNNTLSLAVGANGAKAAVRIPHSRCFDAAAVKAQLGLIDDRLSTFAADAQRLAQSHIHDRAVIQYFVDLYAKTDEKGNLTNETTVKKTVDKLVSLYRYGQGAELPSAHGTLWGALNAVTHFVDFDMRARNDNNRFASAQLGQGKEIKRKAFDAALALAA